jgi:hypothetical protein
MRSTGHKGKQLQQKAGSGTQPHESKEVVAGGAPGQEMAPAFMRGPHLDIATLKDRYEIACDM